uniref:HAT C-terminal dimerisation domain-containing protein n=1 Tax=Esox lucius TaxID=8010 RepID=A0AAY5KZX0_ESOLU
TEIKGKAVCLICGTQVSVLKDYNLNRHYTTKHEDKYRNLSDEERAWDSDALLAKLQTQQGLFTKLHTPRDAAIWTRVLIGLCCVFLCPEKKGAFENVSLSRRTVTRRVEDIAGNLELQLKNRAADFDYFSLALDEICNVRDTAQLLIFLRGITADFQIMEEFSVMKSMKGTTTGNDLFTEVNACLDMLGLKWDKLAGVTTDGCPNLTGKNVGLLKRMQDKVTEMNPLQKLTFLHCIIHQEVLCKTVLKMNHVVDVVTKTVNFIRARALNHRQSVVFLEENEIEHGDISYHCTVRWLSLGKVLKSFWDLRDQIQDFCVKKGHNIPELSDKDFMADLGFAVDVCDCTNERTKCQTAVQGPFCARDVQCSEGFHEKVAAYLKPSEGQHSDPLANTKGNQKISRSHPQSEMHMVSSPFNCSVDNAPSDVQMELIDLQSDTLLAEHFRSVSLLDFYSSLKEENFPHLRRHAQRIIVLFGSTYVREQTFSVMKFNKSKHRSSITDDNLSAVLRIATANALIQ